MLEIETKFLNGKCDVYSFNLEGANKRLIEIGVMKRNSSIKFDLLINLAINKIN